VCREAIDGKKKPLLYAVIKMVELRIVGTTHQSRCTGDGIKPHRGAVVKSYGTERL